MSGYFDTSIPRPSPTATLGKNNSPKLALLSSATIESRVARALNCYRGGSWRAPLFAELVLEDVRALHGDACVLDIGCGNGFDGSAKLQRAISDNCRSLCGIEPDSQVAPPDCFDQVYHFNFEEAPLAESSFDVAYAVFVMEHLKTPEIFWSKLQKILRPGGVFWGFTMDRRHYFTWASTLLERIRAKDKYLSFVQGNNHYANYPTYYRCNTPEALKKYAQSFSRIDSWSWNRRGQLNAYVPRQLRFISHFFDNVEMFCKLPGSLLLVRAVRQFENNL